MFKLTKPVEEELDKLREQLHQFCEEHKIPYVFAALTEKGISAGELGAHKDLETLAFSLMWAAGNRRFSK